MMYKTRPKLKLYRFPRLRPPTIDGSPVYVSITKVEVGYNRYPIVQIRPRVFLNGINAIPNLRRTINGSVVDLE